MTGTFMESHSKGGSHARRMSLRGDVAVMSAAIVVSALALGLAGAVTIQSKFKKRNIVPSHWTAADTSKPGTLTQKAALKTLF